LSGAMLPITPGRNGRRSTAAPGMKDDAFSFLAGRCSWIGLRAGTIAAATSLAATLGYPADASPRATLDLETGVVGSTQNDVAIPGDTGTRFSLTDDLEAEPGVYYRFQASYRLGERHALRALYAPLTLAASGTLSRDLAYVDSLFPAGTPLEARYQFNSYRLTYRYSLWMDGPNELAVGFTAKVRDARVSVVGGGRAEEYTNVGFVPLLHLLARWQFAPPWGLVFEADALAAPQGRAEDVMLALEVEPWPRVSLRLGYRMVEGGADNEKVYTFTWIHYAAVGATTRF
jgi:hypothetical protein